MQKEKLDNLPDFVKIQFLVKNLTFDTVCHIISRRTDTQKHMIYNITVLLMDAPNPIASVFDIWTRARTNIDPHV